MEIEITSKKENPALKRTEVDVRLNFGGGATPSKIEIQESVAKELGAEIEKVEISNIFSDVGRSFGTALVFVWAEKTIGKYTKKGEETPAETPKEGDAAEEAPEKSEGSGE